MSKHFSGLVTSAGTPFVLGKELGRGGEGAVFEVQSEPSLVAKVYFKDLTPAKQSKLVYMASKVDARLLAYTAWPKHAVHRGKRGPVVGFLMNKVADREAIHDVYSPKRRRQEHPKRAWDFLLYTARNTAAAFQELHSHGHVLGDVNDGNVLVGLNSQVCLIDCDSFQVNANGTLHLCEVGVPLFTPPELQGNTGFTKLPRTTNHDNFGLALLIFQLLFAGRHPFMGIPQHAHIGAEIDRDIKGFRYAYARDARARGFTLPDFAVPMSIVPQSIEAMFHAAFTEAGAQGGRPTAAQWMSSLDVLRQRVTTCTASSMHRYPNHLSQCPWCGLEGRGHIYFVDLTVVLRTSAGSFVLAQVWAQIETVPRPPPLQFPNIGDLVRQATPEPLPPGTPGRGSYWRVRVMSFLFFIVASVAWPQGWVAMAMLALLINWCTVRHLKSKVGPQLLARQQQRQEVLATYEDAKNRMRRTVGPDAFDALKSALFSDKQRLERLEIAEGEELKKLKDTAHERQLKAHLERFFLDREKIKGLGPAKRATLAAFGIETAADIEYYAICSIRGFGDSMASTLCHWRKQCERNFRFDPATAVPTSDLASVQVRYAAPRQQLQAKLAAGAGMLRGCSPPYSAGVEEQWATLREHARQLAQAEANLSLRP